MCLLLVLVFWQKPLKCLLWHSVRLAKIHIQDQEKKKIQVYWPAQGRTFLTFNLLEIIWFYFSQSTHSYCFTTELPSLLWRNNDQDLHIFVRSHLLEYLVGLVEIARHPLTCTAMQVFVIDLTSEQSHQPKRIIMRKTVLMMSLSFSALRHPVNFDPKKSLQWYDCEKFN